jgi:hypothetical protein
MCGSVNSYAPLPSVTDERAQNWPAGYYVQCWQQFLRPSAINEGTECHIQHEHLR